MPRRCFKALCCTCASPTGVVQELWRGFEAFGEALQLLKVAEQYAGDQQVAWRQDIMRPALDRKQVSPIPDARH